MRDLPILFSAPMVRAILEGRKTQTRRVVKFNDAGRVQRAGKQWHLDDHAAKQACPYGQPGDRLWVRETFVQGYDVHPLTGCLIQFDDDGNELPKKTWYRATDHIHWSDDDGWEANVPWKPSIHMPRTVSRITLEVTSVHVERLQDMEGQTAFESDALAEGVHRIHHGDGAYYYSAFRDEPHPKNKCYPEDAFRELWESINGAGSWDANPWVWVVEFRRVEVAHG